jgi:restriction system protein
MVPVTCASCGTALDEDAGLKPDEREPCPVCGSAVRAVQSPFVPSSSPALPGALAGNVQPMAATSISVSATVSAGEISDSARLIVRAYDLLLQAVIVPGDKTDEGRLIEAVTIPWFDIIDLLKNDPSIASQTPADKWEEIIAGAYHKSGFEEVTLTPRSGDHGRDVIAVKKGIGSIRVIDQVKAYKPGHLVTADDVRALMGVLHVDGASKGFLTTTSDFAPLLRTDPLISPLIPSRLGLIDGKALLARLEELARRKP